MKMNKSLRAAMNFRTHEELNGTYRPRNDTNVRARVRGARITKAKPVKKRDQVDAWFVKWSSTGDIEGWTSIEELAMWASRDLGVLVNKCTVSSVVKTRVPGAPKRTVKKQIANGRLPLTVSRVEYWIRFPNETP